MSLLFAGGLWTIAIIAALVCGYIWVLELPRKSYWAVVIMALFIIAASQLLPEAHQFRVRIAEGLTWWKWALIIAIPVLCYALVIRWIKQKVRAKDDT